MLNHRRLVMLVDDEIDIIGLFTEILTLNGISVRSFTNAEKLSEGLNKITLTLNS